MISVDSVEFLEIYDSAYTFSLSNNGEALPTPITISKNYGAITLLNLSLFPNEPEYEWEGIDNKFTASIVGIEKDSLGLLNLTKKDIFEFNVGDEMHIASWWHEHYGDEGDHQSYIIKVISKEATDSTFNYEIQQCSKKGIDTLTYVYKTRGFFDKYPGEPLLEESGFANIDYQAFWNNIEAVSYNNMFSSSNNDSCYEPFHFDKKLVENIPMNEYYIKGLGGPYHYFYGFSSESATELVYFKKGETEWGNPYLCEDIVNNIDDSRELIDVELFPNPAKEFINVSAHEQSQPLKIFFYNSLGNILCQEEFIQNTRIDLGIFPRGMVFYSIKRKGQEIQNGSFIKE